MGKHLYRRHLKRWMDLAIVAPALLILSPVLALTAVLVRIGIGKGIIYRQERAGLQGKAFRLYKFRTMLDTRDANGHLLPDDERLTSLGHWLRKYSFDELPQLWNVLRGDISLVVPRPLLLKYVPRYTAQQFRRHEVLPGITGWAQVNGRNAISWEDKFELDVWYVDHLSFWLDAKILLKTLGRALKPSDINAAGCATMPEFQPSSQHSTADDRGSARCRPRSVTP